MKILDTFYGGFGRVEITELDSGEIVAKKIFDPGPAIVATADMGKLLERFKREVLVQKSLDKDHFVEILDFDFSTRSPWFTMPVADKTFQQEIIDCRAAQSTPNGISDILNSLEVLHKLGFVHRDLKPSNILYLGGKWKISDLGLVNSNSLSGVTTNLTSTHSAWGTTLYCAPEQSINFKRANYSMDIYSFGCILHDIFNGGQRVPYTKLSSTGPVGFVIEKCTELNPKKRFKDVASLRGALLSVLSNQNNVIPNQTTAEWIERLGDVQNWDNTIFTQFVHFISTANPSEIYNLHFEISEDILEALYNLDNDLWTEMAISYCEWASITGFGYDYCDVVVLRLQTIYTLGDITCKANAAIAAAILAVGHNRWYVMRKVVDMCDNSIDDNLAQRIAIEIIAENEERSFLRCVEGLNLTSKSYHSSIREILQ